MLDGFVKGLIQNVRDVVSYLESVHPVSAHVNEEDEGKWKMGVKSVNECAVVRCLNQLDRAVRYVFFI